ncbi:hypothetical protein KUV62_12475 [Salipiger bermudensis]|uniref:hypothetical protein n=1 Tax=Salipiger bermudensis TaxID=344736 RepID=UPI001C98FE99|nr:hypothetical protein [Salipiger bermudensis]MBY6004731.1 hypothetical protein [Salipiger bermudensis]
MAFYCANRLNSGRDFTMIRAGVLVALLALAHLMGSLKIDEGEVARDVQAHPQVIPAIATSDAADTKAGPLI